MTKRKFLRTIAAHEIVEHVDKLNCSTIGGGLYADFRCLVGGILECFTLQQTAGQWVCGSCNPVADSERTAHSNGGWGSMDLSVAGGERITHTVATLDDALNIIGTSIRSLRTAQYKNA